VANENSQFKPNFKRQMIYAGGMLAAILVSYLAFSSFFNKPPEPKQSGPQAKAPEAWYKKQGPPPAMITTPDLPLFPDEHEQGDETKAKARAYEEALPKEVYEPPSLLRAKAPVVEPAPSVEHPPEVAALPEQAKFLSVATILPRWQQFAVVATPSGNKPLIAIVIDDMGVDRKRSAIAIDLKAPLTLSFLTYATDLKGQTERARSNGHELMLHVPMEPRSSTVDPGPNALLPNLSEKELRRRLEWGFGRFSTYVGLNNHMGSKFTSDSKAMRIVIEETKRRGLLFLDSRTSGKTVGAKLARELGVPVAERNIFLDHENNIKAVNTQLAQVEKMARRTGAVIAIGHPRDATIKALQVWLKGIEAKGFQLVPLTTIVTRSGIP
jgi:polysaccharide deacetylase 2 family uncharacterized protein YibQ